MFVHCVIDVSEYDEDATFPLASLGTTVLICLDALAYGLSLKPLTFVATTIWPRFDSISFRLSINPLSVVDLAVWELTLAL